MNDFGLCVCVVKWGSMEMQRGYRMCKGLLFLRCVWKGVIYLRNVILSLLRAEEVTNNTKHTISWGGGGGVEYYPQSILHSVLGIGLKLSQQRPDHATICNIPSGIVYHKCWFGQEHTPSKHRARCQREQLPRWGKTFAQFFTDNCKTSSLGEEKFARSSRIGIRQREQTFVRGPAERSTELNWEHGEFFSLFFLTLAQEFIICADWTQ